MIEIRLNTIGNAESSGYWCIKKQHEGKNLVEATVGDDLDQDIELKAIESSSMNADNNETTTPEDETSEDSEVKSIVNNDLDEENVISSLPQQTQKPRMRTRLLKLLNRGSFFAIGLAILIIGGVSSNFHPYVNPGKYENCSITEHLNESRLFKDLMETQQSVNLTPTPMCANTVTSFNPEILKTISKSKTAEQLTYMSRISTLIFISPTPT